MVEPLAMVSTIVEHENIVLARLHLTVFRTTCGFSIACNGFNKCWTQEHCYDEYGGLSIGVLKLQHHLYNWVDEMLTAHSYDWAGTV